ncbi:MAG TPA: hypothetical protein VN441_05360 [Syntrophomonas sp.]|nr:hypothetical protein [Syntrophomonas sp.]
MKKILFFLLTAVLTCILFTGCGAKTPPAESGTPAPAISGTPGPAAGEEQAPAESGKPIYANRIEEGTYKIEVSSSSSMFRIVDAQLTVKDGKMSAVLTLSGDGYEKLYMGTGEEALADSDDKCIYFVKDSEGKYTYTVPVAALDQDTGCTAWSIRKKTWYDRVLVFQSSLIPENAITPE